MGRNRGERRRKGKEEDSLEEFHGGRMPDLNELPANEALRALKKWRWQRLLLPSSA